MSSAQVLGHTKESVEMAILGETKEDFTVEEITAYGGRGTFWSRLMGAIKEYRVGGNIHNFTFLCFD